MSVSGSGNCTFLKIYWAGNQQKGAISGQENLQKARDILYRQGMKNLKNKCINWNSGINQKMKISWAWHCTFLMSSCTWNNAEPFWLFKAPETDIFWLFPGPEWVKKVEFQAQEIIKKVKILYDTIIWLKDNILFVIGNKSKLLAVSTWELGGARLTDQLAMKNCLACWSTTGCPEKSTSMGTNTNITQALLANSRRVSGIFY